VQAVYRDADAANEPVTNAMFHEELGAQQHVKIDKSNLLLIGPTGVGKTYILESVAPPLSFALIVSIC
jgi:ATP-dependent Clp protease ATP-binding subunit ClpX